MSAGRAGGPGVAGPPEVGPRVAGPPEVGPKVVALGGGHGLAASLRALRLVTPHVTAVVTVADDGGSSGRLRAELGVVPPGDLRMALAALAGADPRGRTWEDLLQHRFRGAGDLAGHAVGNLLIAALVDTTGDLVSALDLVGSLVDAAGRVLPASRSPLQICAEVVGVDPERPNEATQVCGQVAVATTPGRVVAVRLEPESPQACEEAVQAVLDADWVVLGPGSWFTSVLPHLLVPGLRDAITRTSARRVLTLNLEAQAGETDGFSPEAHLDVLLAHAPELCVDVVLADPSAVADERGLMAAAENLGAALLLAPVARGDGTPRHDPVRLAEALAGVFAADRTDRTGDPAWR